jgi:hypothetical protein
MLIKINVLIIFLGYKTYPKDNSSLAKIEIRLATHLEIEVNNFKSHATGCLTYKKPRRQERSVRY